MTLTNDLYLCTNATQTRIDNPPPVRVSGVCVWCVFLAGCRGVAKEKKKKKTLTA